jgi:hypothetical protein
MNCQNVPTVALLVGILLYSGTLGECMAASVDFSLRTNRTRKNPESGHHEYV